MASKSIIAATGQLRAETAGRHGGAPKVGMPGFGSDQPPASPS
jgi:hypothetical protein